MREPSHHYCDCKKDAKLTIKKNAARANQGNGNMTITRVDRIGACVYCGYMALESVPSKVRKSDKDKRKNRRLSEEKVERPLEVELQQMYYAETYNEEGSIYE